MYVAVVGNKTCFESKLYVWSLFLIYQRFLASGKQIGIYCIRFLPRLKGHYQRNSYHGNFFKTMGENFSLAWPALNKKRDSFKVNMWRERKNIYILAICARNHDNFKRIVWIFSSCNPLSLTFYVPNSDSVLSSLLTKLIANKPVFHQML